MCFMSRVYRIFSDLLLLGFFIEPPGYPEKVLCKAAVLLSKKDLQAFLEMTHHNGFFGCLNCELEGYSTKSGKGHAHCYPFAAAKQRTNETFRQQDLEAWETGKPVSFCRSI